MSVTSGNGVLPPEVWHEVLREASIEVFSMMVGVEVSASEVPCSPKCAGVTGTVGIAGALSAILSTRCSPRCATQIASRMLGVPPEEAAPQQCDAVGEICNIVAGHFKAKIGLGDKCMLSVPTVITGGNYQLRPLASGKRLDLTLLYEGEPFWIALDIRK